MSRHRNILAGFLLCLGLGVLRAQPIVVPNGSFELPATFFVHTRVDSWQESPKPDWYVEGGGYLWDQLTGVFKNTAPGATDHIENCDGAQALYFFAVPEVGLFQDYDSVDWNDPEPSHAFDARFEVGKAYELTFGVVAGGGNMLEGVSFEAALYYRDASSNQVAVASTRVVFTRDVFPNRTHLTDFQVRLPVVQPGDAWAGQHIGVRFLSTVSQEMQGGYWDLDHIRLAAVGEPVLVVRAAWVDGELRLTWPSATGYRYQVTRSVDWLAWTDFGTPLDGTGGELSVEIPTEDGPTAFFNVVATPAP